MIRARRPLALAAAVALVVASARSQLPDRQGGADQERGYVALQQAVRDAANDTLALVVASHPDDQYLLPAAWLRFRFGVRVAVLLFTRGEGGQNSVGPETGDALAQLRTIEAENAAADHLGATIYYLDRPDHGFSRSAAETLEQWGEQSTVADVARLLRRIRPDLVLTTHHPDEEHGHDLALLRILPEAVRQCADPQFATPDLAPFTVSRLFRRATPAEEDAITVSLPMDVWDDARGMTIRRLAYRALQEHRSQFPLQPMHTLFPSILELVPVPIGDQPLHGSLFDGLPDVFGELRAADRQADALALRQALHGLGQHLSDPPALARGAITALQKLRSLDPPAGSPLAARLARRLAAVEQVILLSAGVHVFLNVPPDVEAAPGAEMPLQIWIGNTGRHRVSGIAVAPVGGGRLSIGSGDGRRDLGPEESLALECRYQPPDQSEDEFLRLFTGDTFTWPLRLRFAFSVDEQPIEFTREIRTSLQPAVQLSVMPRTLLLPRGAAQARFVVRVERKTNRPLDLALRINPPAGMTVLDPVRPLQMVERERYREFTFTLTAPTVPPGVSAMHVHLGDARLRVHVHKVDVAVPAELRVGLVPGVDDTAYEVLQALLGDSRIEKFEAGRPLPILDGARLHTIVVDLRALRSPFARSGFARLLDFARAGGRLVVFYHRDTEFNLDAANFLGAPYELEIGKGRVTRQDAPVQVLAPGHLLFNHPNTIHPQDWDGWRQERGLYFPAKFDARYEALLAMQDPGFPVERGALLYARYGKGEYVYCALALYRQLKHRHAGACRLFANLISPAR